MKDLFSLEGQAAIVTGASKGLGREIAQAYAEAGANVVLVSRNQKAVSDVAKHMTESSGREAVGIGADVGDREAVEGMVAQTLERFGRIDILVNNAGVNVRSPIAKIRDEDWELVQRTNVTGVMYCCRAVVPVMVKAGYGRIINVGSSLSLVGLADRVSYCSSKGAVALMTRTLALELAQTGVTANCLCPAVFATEINRPVMDNPAATEALLSNVPMRRWAKPEEIRAPALFLASPGASFVTGELLMVDGGWTAS